MEFTDSATIARKYESVVNGYYSNITRDVGFRQQQLRNVYYALLDNEQALKDAVRADLRRAPEETEILELNELLAEASLAICSVEGWAAPEKQRMLFQDARYALSEVALEKNPYGAVLVIGPWNYPLQCTLGPIIAALAAGNTVLLKPSEHAPHTGALLAELLEQTLEETVFQAVLGGVAETTQLLEYKWDKIMFTGSTSVGRVVARQAAQTLTPCALELGGKSPVVVTAHADLKLVAKRVAWGKFANAGQTCVAPDYVIVEHDLADELLFRLQEAVKELYPTLEDEGAGKDYARIVNRAHFDRVQRLVDGTKGTVWQFGEPSADQLFFPPTLVKGVDVADALMQEELFAPVLPIIEVDDVLNAAPLIIAKFHDTPLAAYFCTRDRAEQELLLARVRAGAVCINDTLVQAGSPAIPFGGVGQSGSGRYHGRFGFDEFSVTRPVVRQGSLVNAVLNARYPPYTAGRVGLMRWISRPGNKTFPRDGPVHGDSDGRTFRQLAYAYLVAAVAGIYYCVVYTLRG